MSAALRPRRRLSLLPAALMIAAGVWLPAGPAAAAPLVGAFEAETTLTVDAANGSPYADADASGGQALAIWRTAAASGQFTTTRTLSAVVIRAMGGQCDGAPQMRVAIDGVTVTSGSGSPAVTATSWTDYRVSFSTAVAPGTHTIAISFANEYGTASCNRFLEIDKVSLDAQITGMMLAGWASTFAPGDAQVVDDPIARSDDRAARLTGSGGISWTVSLAEGFDTIAYAVRSDGGVCDGNPVMSILVDGQAVPLHNNATTQPIGPKAAEVPNRYWETFYTRMTSAQAAGQHTITIRLTNPYTANGCTRALLVDRIMLSQGPDFGEPAPSGFVSRSGRTLMLNGAPFKFVGLNAYGMSGCDGPAWSDARLDDYFSRLAPNTVTRTWAFNIYGTAHLDRILARAAAHDQKVIFTLSDGRNYCGEHDGWTGSEGADKTTAWYTGGFRTTFKPWVQQVVTRYKDNPAVAMWEIINEPGSFGNTAYTDAMIRTFLDEIAATIKAIDARHLVGSGALSNDMYGTRNYTYVHGGPHIDVASLHEYEYDYQNSNTIIANRLPTLLSALAPLDKPLIVGETGVLAGPSGCRTSIAARVSPIQQKLSGYTAVAGVAGVNVWSVVQYNPVTAAEPCPLEMQVTDPVLPAVRNAQLALN